MFASVVAIVCSPPVLQAGSFQVYIGDSRVEFKKAQPVRRGALFLVPLREVVEKLGGTLVYGPLRRQAFVVRGRNRVTLALDGGTSRIDGFPRVLKAAPWISKGEIVVPADFFSEAMRLAVAKNAKLGFVRIFPNGGFRPPARLPSRRST